MIECKVYTGRSLLIVPTGQDECELNWFEIPENDRYNQLKKAFEPLEENWDIIGFLGTCYNYLGKFNFDEEFLSHFNDRFLVGNNKGTKFYTVDVNNICRYEPKKEK